MAWLLTWFIFTQSTLISYHAEAFVKTEVACTVPTLQQKISYRVNALRFCSTALIFAFKIKLSTAWLFMTISTLGYLNVKHHFKADFNTFLHSLAYNRIKLGFSDFEVIICISALAQPCATFKIFYHCYLKLTVD